VVQFLTDSGAVVGNGQTGCQLKVAALYLS